MTSAIFLFSKTQVKQGQVGVGASPEKNPNREVQNMEFPGVLNKQNVEISGVNTK